MPRPTEERPSSQPWPTYPMIYRVTSAHEEGGERIYSVNTQKFIGQNNQVTGIEIVEVEFNIEAKEDTIAAAKAAKATPFNPVGKNCNSQG